MRLVRAASLVAACVVLCLQPVTAQADVRRQRDAVGDVAQSRVGTNVYTPAPTQVAGDITLTYVSAARRAVWVQLKLRDLTPNGNGNFTLISVQTHRRVRNVEIDAFPGHWEGRAAVTNPRGRPVPCPVTHRIDYDRNRILLRMPRTCVGKAAQWVRVGVRTVVAGTTVAYADEGRGTTVGTALRYGRRVAF
jgi:hypothetical protein